MQVDVDVKCMLINFGGRGLSDFGDIITFWFCQISFPIDGLIVIVSIMRVSSGASLTL